MKRAFELYLELWAAYPADMAMLTVGVTGCAVVIALSVFFWVWR